MLESIPDHSIGTPRWGKVFEARTIFGGNRLQASVLGLRNRNDRGAAILGVLEVRSGQDHVRDTWYCELTRLALHFKHTSASLTETPIGQQSHQVWPSPVPLCDNVEARRRCDGLPMVWADGLAGG